MVSGTHLWHILDAIEGYTGLDTATVSTILAVALALALALYDVVSGLFTPPPPPSMRWWELEFEKTVSLPLLLQDGEITEEVLSAYDQPPKKPFFMAIEGQIYDVMQSSTGMADWSNLPKDLLRIVVGNIEGFLPDFVRFGSVCKEWRSLALDARGASPPLLLLPFDRSSTVCNCLNLSGRNTIGVHLPGLETCCSVARGWLVTVSDELDMQLLHLYTKVQIPLPKYTPSYEEIYPFVRPKDVAGVKFHYVQKLVLSTNPIDSSSDCVIAVICGVSNKLVFCRVGDKNWMSVDGYSNCRDVIFYKNKIYAVANSRVIIHEVGLNPEVTKIPSPLYSRDEGASVYYLVESLEGALFYVLRYREWFINTQDVGTRNIRRKKKFRTCKFLVFKLEQRFVNGCCWSRVDCLGNQVLFVGRNSSFALSSDDFPQFKGNCIYFSDDNVESFTSRPYGAGWSDVGFFSMQDGSVEAVLPNARYCETPPMWFQQK